MRSLFRASGLVSLVSAAVLGGLVMLVSVALTGAPQRQARELFVAAAASLSVIAPSLSKALHDDTGIDVRFNFAGSNTLARQILEGARVDVFISADEAQMDLVDQSGRVVAGTRANVIGNQLVVIARGGGRLPVDSPDDLTQPGVRRIAMGDPRAVPAGVYARQWLEAIRLWSTIEPKVVPLASSPAVVAALREGRADAGIVYATDALAPNLTIAYRVPVENAPRIVYPAAAITGGRIPVAREFVAWLQSASARRVFESAGFIVSR